MATMKKHGKQHVTIQQMAKKEIDNGKRQRNGNKKIGYAKKGNYRGMKMEQKIKRKQQLTKNCPLKDIAKIGTKRSKLQKRH